MFKKILPFVAIGFISSHTYGESTIQSNVQSNVQSTNLVTSSSYNSENHPSIDGFLFPDYTQVKSDLIFNDVMFFYSKEVLDFFDNDHEKLLEYIDGSIAINNNAFKNQNIHLRRNVSAVLPLNNENGLTENNIPADYGSFQKLKFIIKYYNDEVLFAETYNPSYVVGLLRGYPNVDKTVGGASVSGMFSFISAYRNHSPRTTLAHELGHNDGLHHSEEFMETLKFLNLSIYSSGFLCGTHKSIMSDKQGSKSQVFFSSPLVTSNTGDECGVDGVNDVARSYIEAIDRNFSQLPGFADAFKNNKPTPEKTGEVSLTALSTQVNEGESAELEVLWQGAEVGSAIQLILRRNDDVNNNVESFLMSAVFDGTNTTQVFTIPTIDDDEYLENKTFIVELVYPHKVNLGGVTSQKITLVNNDSPPVVSPPVVSPPTVTPPLVHPSASGSDGGSFGIYSVLLLFIVTGRRFLKNKS